MRTTCTAAAGQGFRHTVRQKLQQPQHASRAARMHAHVLLAQQLLLAAAPAQLPCETTAATAQGHTTTTAPAHTNDARDTHAHAHTLTQLQTLNPESAATATVAGRHETRHVCRKAAG